MSIPVTKSYLPELSVYQNYLEEIWQSGWLTNGGNLLQTLTSEISDYLGSYSMVLMSNGTIPIQAALFNLANQGEVITTPFSYVATSSSIVWQGCKPVFVDIDPKYLTIDEEKIEAAITSRTTAILATHIFGNPCNIEAISDIAKRHKLAVIFDAAHCFGVRYKSQSVFNFGDVSTCSFHATKIFHTVEGGAAFSNNQELLHRISYNIHFGHQGQYEFYGIGINGKMSELHAAMGLAVLPKVNEILSAYRAYVANYANALKDLPVRFLTIREETDWNYSYFPIVFETEDQLNKTLIVLNQHDIYPRRYFYPSLNTIAYLGGQKMPVSESISSRILCLPLYKDLGMSRLSEITKYVRDSFL